VYGPHNDELKSLIEKNGIDHLIDYRSEVPQPMLADEMRKCHAMILYSRFETFGCVVIEAMASGIPVIASDIPVMREIIADKKSGVFVPLENPSALADKMLWMMEHYHQFNPQMISQQALELYSFEKAGKMFDDFFTNSSSPTPARSRQGSPHQLPSGD
jgi:glycosyltransferase involved in cell wall biosynthesis